MKRCHACGGILGRDPEHPCPFYRSEPDGLGDDAPAPTDITFIIEAWNSPDGLERYRRYVDAIR